MDGGSTSFETRYVDEVRRHLGDVPRRQRAALVAAVAADLAERPSCDAWQQITAELGEPAAYAAAVRSEHGLPPRVGVRAHVRAVRWPTWVALALVVALAAGAAGWDRWSTADPGITNSCSGVNAPKGVAVEPREAGSVTEQRISYVDAATVGLGLCLSAPHDVEIIDVAIGVLPLSLFQPTIVRAADMSADPAVRAPELEPTTVEARAAGLRVVVEGRLANCEWFYPGGGESFETAEVTYRYRGRTRTTTVDLNTTYTFVSPPATGCPRAAHG